MEEIAAVAAPGQVMFHQPVSTTSGQATARVIYQPGDTGVDIGGTRSPLSLEPREHKTVRLQPEDIGGVGVEGRQSPTRREASPRGDGVVGVSGVSGKKGGEDKVVEVEGRVDEPTETEEVSTLSGGIMGTPRTDEEDIKCSARVSNHGKNTRGGDSGPSPQQLPKTMEALPGAMACEPSSADLKHADIGHSSRAAEGHNRAIDGKKHDKPQAKRVSFAPEPSESNAQEITATGGETKELEKVADAPGEFGYNIGAFKGHDRAIDEKRQSQPADKESYPTQQPRQNPETEELERIADVVGGFGYNVGTIKGHDRAIDNRYHDEPLQGTAHAPAVPASESELPDVETQRARESQEPGNMAIGSGGFRYNGSQPNSDPGGRRAHGTDMRGQRAVPGSGASAGISEGRKSNNTSTATPSTPSQNTDGTAESQELSSITIESGEFGYNIGGLLSSHPDRHKAHRQRSSRQSEGREGTAPEEEELGRITIESGDFGYNVGGLPSSHPDRHRRHSHKPLQDQAGQEPFGLERCQRGTEKEIPTTLGGRHRDKKPTNENPSHTSNTRDTTTSFNKCPPGGTASNDTPQSYHHSFVSQFSGRPISPPQPMKATEMTEPEKPSAPPGYQSQTSTIHEPHSIPADPKSGPVTSITGESDLGTTCEQHSGTPQAETDKHHLDGDVETEFVKPEMHSNPEEVRNKAKGVGRMVVWGVIGAGVIIVLGLIALWGPSHAEIGFGLREVVGWLDTVAEWLFEEGKKGSS
ncbi:hypothetical protein C7212DRAFT_365474 [Tuber magnatum]|uniref:Uncharacterized protein n=1 Tax=Tuber magnatum TaxID=42249 RepID=A0A317SIA3_9PEZI|nr:hypothetical protein C7212DRAFT_365474 [Tuber magnatum]